MSGRIASPTLSRSGWAWRATKLAANGAAANPLPRPSRLYGWCSIRAGGGYAHVAEG